MVSQKPLQVTIVDNSKSEKCEGRCGLEFSSPDTVEFVKEHLNKQFGDTVQIEYLDLADPKADNSHPEISKMMMGQNLLLPLLLINGKLRISGYFDIHILQSAIQTDIEMEQGLD